MPTRRELLKSGLSAALVAATPRALFSLETAARKSARTDRPYFDAAVRAARWIRTSRIQTDTGVVWPADPKDEKSIASSLYTGTPGVILFLLEMHRATGDRAYLDDACAGADHLVATLPKDDEPTGCGFYEGIAGHAYVLDQVARASDTRRYADFARITVSRIHREARTASAGVEWSDTTDVISGSSGIGLFLLDWGKRTSDSTSSALAVKAGKHSIELAEPAPGGLRWRVDPKFPRIMPNFSHGTAGVAYFLATLHQQTGDPAFLTAALAGAAHLQHIAKTDDDTCTVYHHEGDGENLFYLGWCHGPVGTARLFQRLAMITRSSNWLGWVRRSARGILASGVPRLRTPGFWNNVSQCCGNTGVAQFYLDLHRTLGDSQYLENARLFADDMLNRATPDGDGLKWVQAENRIEPNVVVAQTGFMQGAAGMGTLLLHFDGYYERRAPLITFPDSPYA